MLLITAQAIARQIRAGGEDLQVLRALGAGPAMTAADGLTGILGAVLAGSLLAVGVAVALSPIAPIGPVRPVYPSPGVAFAPTVLGLGFLALAGGLGTVAVVLARRGAPHRGTGPGTLPGARGSGAARLAAVSGLPAPAVAGIHFAFDPGRGRGTVPARSAISATVLAVVMVVATLTFGSSLTTLVTHPALYGWNWTYALSAAHGNGAVPQQQAGSRLSGNPDVAAWTRISFATAELDGQAVPVLFFSPHAALTPPILSGHPVNGRDQIVLGPATLALLHQHLGGTVTATIAAPTGLIRGRLIIVGTATMPAVGAPQVLHTSMGTGAVASDQLFGAAAASCYGPPGMAFVRLRPGISSASGRASMQRLATGVNNAIAPPRKQRMPRRHPHGPAGAASGPDRQLPHDGRHTGPASIRPGSRRDRSARPHPAGVRAPPQAGPGGTEDDRLHPPPAGRHGRLAGISRRDHRDRRGRATRHRARPVAVDLVRPADLRGAATHRPGRDGDPRDTRHPRARQPSGGPAGP